MVMIFPEMSIQRKPRTSEGSPNSVGGLAPSDYLRNFDTTGFAVTFSGDTCYLKPIVEAVQDLREKAAIESQKMMFS